MNALISSTFVNLVEPLLYTPDGLHLDFPYFTTFIWMGQTLVARYNGSTMSRQILKIRCIMLLGALVATVSLFSVSLAKADRNEVDRAYLSDLQQLAEWCDENGLEPEAELTLGRFIERDSRRRYVFLPGSQEVIDRISEQSGLHRQWQSRLDVIRKSQGRRLFRLATQTLKSGNAARSYRLLNETLNEDPNHQEARRILGYRTTGERLTKSGDSGISVSIARARHPKLGWQPGQYWRINSPQFRIVTNKSGQAGRELANNLEELTLIWHNVFFSFWGNEATLKATWKSGPRTRRTNRRSIVLFANREQYDQYLKRLEPNIGISVGYYQASRRIAYFYADDAPPMSYVHETTHQLFHEYRAGIHDVAAQANTWIVEGVALYMESLRRHDGYYTLGGIDADRLQFARYRAFNEQFYVPLEQLVSLGRVELQQDARIRRLYSQSAGLTHFLMDGSNRKYELGLMTYLRSVYARQESRKSLGKLIGVDSPTLDRQYHEFLDVDDRDLGLIPQPALILNLCLGNTQIQDDGVVSLRTASNLRWLDLANTQVTDRGVRFLPNCQFLRQLNLEGTKITDESLIVVGKLPNLQELDLSNTRIRNTGLQRLNSLSSLRSLWLTNTQVSDEGLVHLEALKQLEHLDVTGTSVTEGGLDGLRRILPQLHN